MSFGNSVGPAKSDAEELDEEQKSLVLYYVVVYLLSL
jgi:hypothetical protein